MKPDKELTGDVSPRWRHKTRKTLYTEVARGFASIAALPIEDHTAVVIYRGQDGTWWVRNAVEFDDGRFEPVGRDPGKERS